MVLRNFLGAGPSNHFFSRYHRQGGLLPIFHRGCRKKRYTLSFLLFSQLTSTQGGLAKFSGPGTMFLNRPMNFGKLKSARRDIDNGCKFLINTQF